MSREHILFSADGVPTDLLRAGEPRLRRTGRSAARAQTTSRAGQPLARLANRLLPS